MPKQRQNQVTDKMIEAFREWEEQTYGWDASSAPLAEVTILITSLLSMSPGKRSCDAAASANA